MVFIFLLCEWSSLHTVFFVLCVVAPLYATAFLKLIGFEDDNGVVAGQVMGRNLLIYERPRFPRRGLSVFMAENVPLGLFRYRFFHWAVHTDGSGKLHPENEVDRNHQRETDILVLGAQRLGKNW